MHFRASNKIDSFTDELIRILLMSTNYIYFL